MNARAGSKYPQIGPLVVQPGATNPYTVQFARSFERQRSRINEANVAPMADNIPGYDALSFQYNKVLLVDGAKLVYPVVLSIGFAKGRLYACPDGVTIRETLNPKESSQFWTEAELVKYPLASFGQIPEPFSCCPALRAGLFSPMSLETQALVRYLIILHAKDTELTKHRLEFPDFEALEKAFRLLTRKAAERDDETATRTNCDEPGDAEIEGSGATGHSSREDDGIAPVVSLTCHSTQTSPPDLEPPVQPIVPHQHSESQTHDEKRERDLNTLLSRRRHTKIQVEIQYRLADYKDYETRRLLHMGEQWAGDADKCLKEARKARILAKEEQLEIDAIDKLLEKELGGDSPMDKPTFQGSRIAHLTLYGVKGLGREE
jgi:hypothetical protein